MATGKRRRAKSVKIVPREDIEPHIDELRSKHPTVTDFQAEIVKLVIHMGWSVPKIAQHLGVDQQRVRYHMEREQVCAYRTALAMAAMGWDALLAQHELVRLLHSRSHHVRLEAAKDIVARAGLSMDRPVAPAVAVQLNFGVSPSTPQLIGSGRASEDSET